MCTEVNLINLQLLIKNQDLDHLRRILKKGERIFLLSEEEKLLFEQINFNPEDPKTITEEFQLASKISGIPFLDITGIGIDQNVLFINVKKSN